MNYFRILSLIIFVSVLVSCNKNKTDDEVDIIPPVQYEYYIFANIDGVEFESGIEVGATSNFDPYGTAMSFRPIYNGASCVDMIYEPGLYPFGDESLPSMGVGFQLFLGEMGFICAEELENFETLFTNGTFDFAVNDTEYGVSVNYATTSDGTGDYYTSHGPQDNAATFQVTEVSEELIDLNNKYVVVTGIFNCRVYNELDPNDFIDILNGKFKVAILSWNTL